MKTDKEKRAMRIILKIEKKRMKEANRKFRANKDPKPYKREKFNEATI